MNRVGTIVPVLKGPFSKARRWVRTEHRRRAGRSRGAGPSRLGNAVSLTLHVAIHIQRIVLSAAVLVLVIGPEFMED